MKSLSFAAIALLVVAPRLTFAADTSSNRDAKLDAKAGILDHEWRIAKLAPRRSVMLPKQLRFGLPPVEQQVFDAQASPASLVESLTPAVAPVVTVPVPSSAPSLTTAVVPASGPTCTTVTTPNGTFTTCTP